MKKLSFTTIILFFLFISFAQENVPKANIGMSDSIIKVTLLGTGTPQPLMERFGPSILVQAGKTNLLFDA